MIRDAQHLFMSFFGHLYVFTGEYIHMYFKSSYCIPFTYILLYGDYLPIKLETIDKKTIYREKKLFANAREKKIGIIISYLINNY